MVERLELRDVEIHYQERGAETEDEVDECDANYEEREGNIPHKLEDRGCRFEDDRGGGWLEFAGFELKLFVDMSF